MYAIYFLQLRLLQQFECLEANIKLHYTLNVKKLRNDSQKQ